MTDKNFQGSAYHKLTPVDDADLGEYENALLYALTEKDVRNIAITGVYGSGKSSLIKSFEEKYKDDRRFNFLNISLASFVMEQNPKFNNEEVSANNIKKTETQDIEKSLLQQIIFKVKSDALEDSQFSRIKIKRYLPISFINRDFLTTHFWSAFFVVTLLLSTKFVFKQDYHLFKDNWFFNKEYLSFYEVIVFVGLLGLIQLIFNWVPKLGLSKFSAGGAEISFSEKSGDSILNKHLDELIYFFATTRFNIVVFEDLDRLPSRDILIKLREINQLINNSEEINDLGKKKVVKFVFALGDDLFTDAIDRTKFFDFILPVIPVVNHSNSRQKLEDAIRKAFPRITFRPNFLDEVTQFLGDLRLLFNVANEFIVYKKRLDVESAQSKSKDKLKLDESKLLAVIIYKNKYPDDFAKLNQRQGKVWDVLSSKNNLIEALTSEKNEDISIARAKIASGEAEKLTDLSELKLLYLGAYLLKYPNLYQFDMNDSSYTPDEIYRDDSLFDLLTTQSMNRYTNKDHRYQQPIVQFSNIEKEIHPELTYKQRKERLNNKSDTTLSALNSNILKSERELNSIQRLTLSKLVQKQPDIAFKGLSVDDGLIKYLILEGLIEEDYLSFTTYFYPGELSASDQQYLTAQLSNTPLELSYKLDNPDKIFDKVKVDRFKNLAILNLDMLTYLSQHQASSDKFKNFIDAIIEVNEKGYDFLNRWLNLPTLQDESKKTVLNIITQTDALYWSRLFELLDLTKDQKDNLVISLLEHLDQKSLEEINTTAFIQTAVNDNVEIFSSTKIPSFPKLEKLFKFLKVLFSSLEQCNDEKLLAVIEESRAYEITIPNLTKILSRGNQTSEIATLTYTYLMQQGSEVVKMYIQDKLSEFSENVLLNLENAEESETSAISLLENENLNYKLKVNLIRKLNFKIIKIDSITNPDYWSDLLSSKRIEVTWDNVIKYFKHVEQDIDDVLVAYLNDNENVTSITKAKLRVGIPDELELARKIVRCDRLDDEKYKQLTISIAISFKNLSDLEINSNKIDMLLESGKFALTSENHEFLKANLPNKSYILIEQYIDNYFKDPTKYVVTPAELVSLVSAPELSVVNKINLVKVTPEIIYDSALAKAYSEFDLTQSTEKLFNIPLLKKLFTFDLTEEIKIKLFNRYCNGFDNPSILEIIGNMPDKIARLCENGRSTLQKNEVNLRFADFLKTNQYISFKEHRKDSTKIELFPKRKLLKST